MERSKAVGFALAALSGLLQVLVFPSFSLTLLAAFAVAPLLYALAKEPKGRTRFLLGWLCGSIYWGGTCYWVYGVMHEYGGLDAPAAAAIYAGFLLAKGLPLGVFALLAGPVLRTPWAIPGVAALWVAIEGAHQYLGFTWLLLGNAATSMSLLAALAPYTGVYGPSFVLAAFNVAAALLLLRRPRRELAWLVLLLPLPLLPHLPDGEIGTVPVRMVQPAVHPDEVMQGWNAGRALAHFRQMLAWSMEAGDTGVEEKPALLIWPEYTVPVYYFDSQMTRNIANAAARAVGAPMVLNTVAYVEVDGERRPMNSAIVISPDGDVLSRYSKRYLVPFGEFTPWPFSLFIDKITLEAGDFYPGQEVVVTPIGEHSIATYICYENVFPTAVSSLAAAGAEALVNVSNDSWYGPTAARYQHLLIARMRAIETQRYILRATADGITTVINRAGQITPPLPSFRPGVLNAHFAYHDDLTWFVRFGEWFWYASILGAAAAWLAARAMMGS
ncbi:MAG: apolipoprotein N-acyltransferase [Bryobacterales bacterium]